MSDNNKHIKRYTAADIERYLNRQMPAKERHAMEKAALEDPFLAEAIEGYAHHSSPALSSDIEDLRKRLQEKAGPKVMPLRSTKIWWSAAAAILIVLGTAFTWYWLAPTENNIAQQKEKEQKIEPLQEKENTDKIADEVTGSTDSAVQENKNREQSNTPAPRPGKASPVLPPAAPQKIKSSVASQPKTKNDSAFPDLTVNAADQATAANILRAQKAEEAESEKSPVRASRTIPISATPNNAPGAVITNIITGKITDNHNKPLPFVNIRISNTPAGTYSDAGGNFKLLSGDTSLLADIKSVGFQPQQVVLYAGAPVNNIILRPDGNQLSEVVVSGYGTQKKKATATRDESADESPEAEPADGWGNYDIYLVNNTRLPETAFTASRGFVDLSFSVDQYGRLSDFKIIHSTCPQCNKEAIRVVKEGPQWKLTEGSSTAQVTLTIQF
ncbi:carboxypeptidase-like regulatory domain-containing protein [Agriterribacter sp.]|uniref:energy transducer TonB n=1 Tax=Agriterribacter sp. TaxID=2821509 RepID=UPI002B8E3AD4|nr:carboxypeptidase-like regulatory domain-containing protein [Agriterribacter sp.]HRO48355.1 carboxypeptidase-like regulatory domain-containing protein [Agriterribacter sp.]